MAEITADELTCLMLAQNGESLAPIGRWKPAILELAEKGLLQKLNESNYTITAKGREIGEPPDDAEPFRQMAALGGQIVQARSKAQQSAEQAAIHLSHAAQAWAKVTGATPQQAAEEWSREILKRALDILRG